jgi:uncharacterized protein (TIGR02996 family)
MPANSRVERCVEEVKAKGGNANPYAVCQTATKQNSHAGKPIQNAAKSKPLLDRLGSLFVKKERLQRSGQPIKFAWHDDFHQAIANEPNEPFHRLVYADWLEEHGMPHTAEIIRLHVHKADPHALHHEGQSAYLDYIHGPYNREVGNPPELGIGLFTANSHNNNTPYASIGLWGRVNGVNSVHLLGPNEQHPYGNHDTADLRLAKAVLLEHNASPEDVAAIDAHIKRQKEQGQSTEPEQLQAKPKMSDTMYVPPAQGARMLQRLERVVKMIREGVPKRFTHREFAHAIAKEPNESSHKLIYADWLEEHGFPHTATIIRLAHEKNDRQRVTFGPWSGWPQGEAAKDYDSEDRGDGTPIYSVKYRSLEGIGPYAVVHLHGHDTPDASYIPIISHYTRDLGSVRNMMEELGAPQSALANHDEAEKRQNEWSEKLKADTEKWNKDNPESLRRFGQPVRFAEEPLRAKPLRSGLVELPKIEPQDERQSGMSPRFAAGHRANAENLVLRDAIRWHGAPIHEPAQREAITQAYNTATANVLRTHQAHPLVQEYLRAGKSPEQTAYRDSAGSAPAGYYRQSARNLIGLVRTVHPWLASMDSKRRPAEETPPELAHPQLGQKPIFDYADWLSKLKQAKAMKQAIEPDFAPPTLPMAQDLPPLKPAKLPGELSRKPGRGGRIGTLEEMHASNASREQMVEGLMRKFLLTPEQARRTVGAYLKRKAMAQRLWRGFDEIIRMRRG